MKVYKIPVVWQSWALVEVEAVSLDQAKQIALDGELPYCGDYIDDSLEIDEEAILIFNEGE